jgi:hypothetical protein
MTVAQRRWASKATLAKYLDVDPETIERWREQGLITAYRCGPKLLRYDIAEIDDMITSSTEVAS